jgi:excisionase family DNA binding protein
MIISAQQREYQKPSAIDLSLVQAKEYLSIKETCLLLGISRMSLHRYIKKNLIRASNLGGKIIIKRKSIDHLLE